jgi:hypothetical protein
VPGASAFVANNADAGGETKGSLSRAPELKWLMYTALLAGSPWIPFIIGVNITDLPGKKSKFVRPRDHSQMKLRVHRSLRAHQNLLERLLPFAIVVFVGAISRISTSITFFWLRVAHTVGMMSGLAHLPLRPMFSRDRKHPLRQRLATAAVVLGVMGHSRSSRLRNVSQSGHCACVRQISRVLGYVASNKPPGMSPEESAAGTRNAAVTGGTTHSVGAQKYSRPLIATRRKPYCSGFGRDDAHPMSNNTGVRMMKLVKCFMQPLLA